MFLESALPRPVAAPLVEVSAPHVASLRPVVRAVVARVLRLPLAHAEVDDCVAETFRRVVENIARVRPGEPVGPWASGIARHVALDALRARKRERARSVDDVAAELELIDPGPSPEDRALDAERMAGLRRALATLPDGSREAILAFHVEGMSYQDIAARLGVPMGTIATWIARGRRTLADALDASRRRAP